jgi:sarcosine oxidase/L-pipecolate oxidase
VHGCVPQDASHGLLRIELPIDTADAQWLFCEDPRWQGLYLATGDSGHSFHTLPYVGHEIADMLEGKVGTLAQSKQPT